MSVLSACGNSNSVAVQDRARLIAEEIKDEPACLAYKKKLNVLNGNESDLESAYKELQKAHCIKGDI